MKLRNKKTGEVIAATITVCKWTNDYEDILTETEYENISDIMEDWEDYKPADPLIKDEKVRKALIVWAETLGVTNVHFNKIHSSFTADVGSISFYPIKFYLEDDKRYAIAELCGEEEK